MEGTAKISIQHVMGYRICFSKDVKGRDYGIFERMDVFNQKILNLPKLSVKATYLSRNKQTAVAA